MSNHKAKEQKEEHYVIPPPTKYELFMQTVCRVWVGGVYALSFGIIFYSIGESVVKRFA